MDNKHLKFLYFLPILVLLLGVNIFINPASISLFTMQEELWAKKMLDGNIVFLKKSDFSNERKLKQKLIEQMPKETDVIVIGPSLVLEIRRKDAGVVSLYNLAVSRSDIYDLLAQLGLIEINGIKTKKMILCIHTLLFDEEAYNKNKFHNNLRSYSDYMISVLDNNTNTHYPNRIHEVCVNLIEYIQNVFSITYFQAGIKYAIKKEITNSTYSLIKESTDYDIKKIDGPAYMSDGSYIHSQTKQNVTLKDTLLAIKRRNEVEHNPYHTVGAHMSTFSKEIFEKVIQYYLARGVNIELFLCPYPPSYWDIISNMNYPIINEQEEFAKDMVKKYNVSITGSLNPYNVGVKDEDYYDASHMRYASLSKYFDFKK